MIAPRLVQAMRTLMNVQPVPDEGLRRAGRTRLRRSDSGPVPAAAIGTVHMLPKGDLLDHLADALGKMRPR
jgi:hypothetical protein